MFSCRPRTITPTLSLLQVQYRDAAGGCSVLPSPRLELGVSQRLDIRQQKVVLAQRLCPPDRVCAAAPSVVSWLVTLASDCACWYAATGCRRLEGLHTGRTNRSCERQGLDMRRGPNPAATKAGFGRATLSQRAKATTGDHGMFHGVHLLPEG